MAELYQIFVHVASGRARSFSKGVAIRYVLPVLWMTLCFCTVALQRYVYSIK